MKLVFEDKVPASYRAAFTSKVIEISNKLGVNPNWLMAIMELETAGTFSPSITNNLGYTGLIQFGSAAAKDVGTTTAKLRQMTAVEQLDYVYKYFLLHKGKYKSYVDTYLAVFFPLAIGKPDDWVIQGGGLTAKQIYDSNPAFRFVKDGKVRVWEVKKALLKRLPSEWLNDGSFSLAVKAYKGQLLTGLILISLGATYIYYAKYRK